MNDSALIEPPPPSGQAKPAASPDRLVQLQHAVQHAAHLLPAQGPIEVFVHHNTLHALEDLPFEQAVTKAAALYGCQPYLSEDFYRAELASGRILPEDLSAVLIEDLGDEAEQLIGFLGTRFGLRLAMLEHPLRFGSDAELQWLMAETDALKTFRPETSPSVRQRITEDTRRLILRDFSNGIPGADASMQSIVARVFTEFEQRTIDRWSAATWESFTLHLLWEVCRLGGGQTSVNRTPCPDGIQSPGQPSAPGNVDRIQLVNEVLIRFCAAFLDQGYSHWTLPQRDAGFYRSFLELYGASRPVDARLRKLPSELCRLQASETGPLESLEESLRLLGVSDRERDEFLTSRLLALPGWAGMIWQMETNAEWAVHPAPAGTLVEYLAVRLILERMSGAITAGASRAAPCETDADRHVSRNNNNNNNNNNSLRAFQIFQLAQIRGWTPFDLHRLSPQEWTKFLHELNAFDDVERRRIYHLAYERRYRMQVLDAVLVHQDRKTRPPQTPRFQVICCIDEREESFRRHLEEIAPSCETLAAAGFFGVAMYYRGLADAHFRPLCPNIIKPSHYVQEEIAYSLAERHRRQSEARRVLGKASLHWHVGTRSLSGGIVTGLLGSLASVPLLARSLFPRMTARLRKHVSRLIHAAPITELRMKREATVPAPGPALGQIDLHPPLETFGYTLEEMANIVERILRDIGLTSGFARLVVFLGHGSASLNNPHESAYNCGACSGGHGGANARVFCRMANHLKVREILQQRGFDLPDHTLFLGGEHNTCDDGIELFDLERLPSTHVGDVDHLRGVLEEARRRNAHERCRRFESAPLTLTPEDALMHVEARAEDLSQARPEYNHATNALCIVGRRELTRGLFLDRRAFLASYDPEQDDAEHAILARILSAVIPVCAGISLEYYFSRVDVSGYGCGNKLPHNITSLLGVMEGASSDLRPGLSAQMVEIHEPLRILFLIETTPEAMLSIMERNETIRRLVRREWVQLAVLVPELAHSGRGSRDHARSEKVVERPTQCSSPSGASSGDGLGTPSHGAIHLFHRGQFWPYHPQSTEIPSVPSSLDWYRGWRGHLGLASIGAASGLTAAAATGRSDSNGETGR